MRGGAGLLRMMAAGAGAQAAALKGAQTHSDALCASPDNFESGAGSNP